MGTIKVTDPFGGVRGDAVKDTNPFAIDKMTALKEINYSIDQIEGRRVKKKSILEQMRDGTWGVEEKIPNWEPAEDQEFENYHIMLRWSGREIAKVRNVSKKEAKIALAGVKAFINNVNPSNPDFTNPLVAKCYNSTAKTYGLDPVPVPETSKDRRHPHLFAGIRGDDSALSQNRFMKDVLRAIKLVDFSIGWLECVDQNIRKRPAEYRIKHTRLCKPTYRDAVTHFDCSLVFANETIVTEKNIPLPRAKIALASMRGWLRRINPEKPDLTDPNIAKCYEATKIRTKPGRYSKSKPELLPMEDGGSSYWSTKLHCWITGSYDKDGVFVPPDWSE